MSIYNPVGYDRLLVFFIYKFKPGLVAPYISIVVYLAA